MSITKAMRFSCFLFLCGISFELGAAAQGALPVEPGLVIPNDDFPWAMEKFDGTDQVVPIHQSSSNFNNHTGANFAGGLTESFFYKPKITTELPGVKARTIIHDPQAVFYLRYTPDPAGDGNPNAKSAIVGWEILRAALRKGKREFQAVRITVLTNHGSRADRGVDSEIEQLAGGWTKITPKAPLEAGEYAIAPICRDPKFMSGMLFDFSLDPAGKNDTDAVSRTATQ